MPFSSNSSFYSLVAHLLVLLRYQSQLSLSVIVLQRKVGTDVLNLNILGMLSCLERDQTYQERTHAHADWSRNLSRAGLHPGAP